MRQLLRHRFKLVRFRTSVKNQLHALAMGQGVCRRKKLWAPGGPRGTGSLALILGPAAAGQELLELLDQLNPTIEELDRAVSRKRRSRPAAVL